MIRQLIPAVRLVLFTAGIIFLLVPFCFSKDISDPLSVPHITKSITDPDIEFSGMRRFEKYYGSRLLEKGYSAEYVDAVMGYRSYQGGSEEYLSAKANLIFEHVRKSRRLLNDLKNTVIVMKKGMIEDSMRGEGIVFQMVLSRAYRVMRQDLRRLFTDGNNVVEVETSSELFSAANTILSDPIRKVIILDDGSLIGSLSPEAILAGINKGEHGVNFCMIIADAAKTQMTGPAYMNIKAMAMMGLAVLSRDPGDGFLYDMAYKTFTEERPVPQMQWIMKVPPRAIPEGPDEQRRLNRLFAEAT